MARSIDDIETHLDKRLEQEPPHLHRTTAKHAANSNAATCLHCGFSEHGGCFDCGKANACRGLCDDCRDTRAEVRRRVIEREQRESFAMTEAALMQLRMAGLL